MHWLTLHLLRERQVALLVAPFLFLVYGIILLLIWQNGIDFFSCLGFTVTYMVIDHFATLRRYRLMLAPMPIDLKTMRLVSYQYIGCMLTIYSSCFTLLFLFSETFYQVFPLQKRLFAVVFGLVMVLAVVNGLILIDVWTRSSLAQVFIIFLLFSLLLPNRMQMTQFLEAMQWWQLIISTVVVIFMTYGVWLLYPKRLQLKDVEG